ncbi:hypothetical protein HQ346_00415 [Rhodococcus sp. BP-252]|nr:MULTISPECIES: hypothetical protein [Rhodococcus]MBY6410202.1 hypothetical protein [Rhodococcus sp. BP-320]MBY6415171.1 hypothetical protein [Rhodococcus sp. BP-321]MBY6421494.1 hypothetical protein [Rhodococcus sp. BP-324]MBY6425521.1 hypothetical protein [Rhodococcus sp. BP-323]MBY6430067.1 hypothetical protein [Rhodococcus sp. BP-322]
MENSRSGSETNAVQSWWDQTMAVCRRPADATADVTVRQELQLAGASDR